MKTKGGSPYRLPFYHRILSKLIPGYVTFMLRRSAKKLKRNMGKIINRGGRR